MYGSVCRIHIFPFAYGTKSRALVLCRGSFLLLPGQTEPLSQFHTEMLEQPPRKGLPQEITFYLSLEEGGEAWSV